MTGRPSSPRRSMMGVYGGAVSSVLTQLLGRLGLATSGWETHEPAHNRWLTPGIWDLRRSDANGGGTSTRLIVKHLSRYRPGGQSDYERHWTANSDDPRRWNYWAREALAYESGAVQSFATAGLAAPQCVGVEITDDDAIVALQFVDGIPADRWSIADYAEAARALGAGQAAYLVDSTFAATPWMSQGFVRDYSTEKPVAWELLDDDHAWQQPLVRDCFPAELRAAVGELHHRREELYAILESQPQTLCHLDFWTKNLIKTTSGFVLLDWAFVGIGAAGEDIGNLVPDAAFDHFIDPSQLPELRAAVLGGYLAGLAAAGWNGGPPDVESTMAASAVKYDWLTPLMLERASAAVHMQYGGAGPIDATQLYTTRGVALLDNAEQGLRALSLAAARRG